MSLKFLLSIQPPRPMETFFFDFGVQVKKVIEIGINERKDSK